MRSTDMDAFYAVIARTWAAYSKPLEPITVTVWAEDLADYELDEIDQALKDHRRDPERGRFLPTVADVMAKIQLDDGHPTAEQCWECNPLREEDGVVWTDTWKQAYYDHVYPLVAEGKPVDKSRRYFIDDYGRRVKIARERGELPRWESSGSIDAIYTAIRKQVKVGMKIDPGWLQHWSSHHPALPPPKTAIEHQTGMRRIERKGTGLVKLSQALETVLKNHA